MGLDSLMALELRNRLESALERSLSATLAWNYPTVETLVAHLDDLIGGAAALPDADDGAPRAGDGRTPGATTDSAAALLAGIAALSDDDALRALRGGR